MLTVACVLRSGGIYDAEWVAKLKTGVALGLSEPHRFVCLSDVDVPCECMPLEHDWPGWWAKMEALRLPGPVLFLDLDTLVVGDLSGLARLARERAFTILRDFYRPDGLQSAVMTWGGDVSWTYEKFKRDPEGWMAMLGRRGDQGFVESVVDMESVTRIQDELPERMFSYKAHRCEFGVPETAALVCLHGKPKFRDMPEQSWVRRAWEDL